MKQSFIFKRDANREYLLYFAVIPLYLYGLYKNGYLLYTNKYIDLTMLFKVILYPILTSVIGLIIGLIYKDKQKELLRFGILSGLVAPFNFNMFAYLSIVTVCLFLVALVPNKFKINELALLLTILIILNKVFNNSILFNPMELTNKYKFTLFDLFFGRGASLLYTSSIFWMICSYFILIFIKTYKKNIFLISGLVFTLLFIIYMVITKEYLNPFKLYLNGTTFFAFIFMAPINVASPSIDREITVFSILLGILTFILVFIFKVYTGAIIAVLVLSIIYRIYFKIRQKMFLAKI